MSVSDGRGTLGDDDDLPLSLRRAAGAATASAQQGVADVLREMNAFLREQLEHKRHWYEQALEEQKAELNRLRELAQALHAGREKFRFALASAVALIRHEIGDKAAAEVGGDLLKGGDAP